MRKGRGVRRGHDHHDRSRNRPTASMDGEWRPARTSSAFGTKAVQRGVHSVHRGKCRPSGCGRSARTSPMLGTKPSTGGVGGEWRLTWTSSRIWDESRSDGRLFSSQRQMPAIGLKTTYERQARTSFRVRDENRPERRLSGFSRAEGMRPSWRVYSPVTRIQSPIKEKT